MWDAAVGSALDRRTTFVALGGGVIGDMTGFAAAAYQRGVHFLQVRHRHTLPSTDGRHAQHYNSSGDFATVLMLRLLLVSPV